MFTGIVTDIGTVLEVRKPGDTVFRIGCSYDPDSIDLGASIACSGACLTVVDTGREPRGTGWFTVQASAETLSRTTLGAWGESTRVNLERALRLGDELGGHIVSGHVDGVASIVARSGEGDSQRFSFEVPESLAGFVASKGSVTLDGVSLTVNEVEGARFGVNLIAHTLAVTTLGQAEPGGQVNVEIDMLARYVARLMETRRP
jgi:riboflavin synthase